MWCSLAVLVCFFFDFDVVSACCFWSFFGCFDFDLVFACCFCGGRYESVCECIRGGWSACSEVCVCV